MHRIISYILCFLILFCAVCGTAQLRIVVEQVPANTPIEDTLYLASSINNWNPKDANFKFSRTSSGGYELQLDQLPDLLHVPGKRVQR